MPTYRFEGHSDDTFGEYAVTKDDYDNCASGEPIVYLLTFTGDGGGSEGIFIVGQYAPKPVDGWLIGISPFDPGGDDVGLPRWAYWFTDAGNGYSPALHVEAPEGCQLSCLNRKES